MRKLTVAIAAAAAMSLATAANAATVETFTLNTTAVPEFVGNNFGTITVTKVGNILDFAVQLVSGYEFRQSNAGNGHGNGEHHALAFKLDKKGETLTNIQFSGFSQAAGSSFHAPPFGQPYAAWDYAVDCRAYQAATPATPPKGKKPGSPGTPEVPGCQPGYNKNGNMNLNPTKMSFSIAGIDFSDLKYVKYATKDIYFVADVVNVDGKTGSIGATFDVPLPPPPSPGVPEPATWALMILGFGSLGAMMRRRQAALRAA
jgi:hypothetical protein